MFSKTNSNYKRGRQTYLRFNVGVKIHNDTFIGLQENSQDTFNSFFDFNSFQQKREPFFALNFQSNTLPTSLHGNEPHSIQEINSLQEKLKTHWHKVAFLQHSNLNYLPNKSLHSMVYTSIRKFECWVMCRKQAGIVVSGCPDKWWNKLLFILNKLLLILKYKVPARC